MTTKWEKRREVLGRKLIGAARGCIERLGLSGLRARDIATEAGCALGGIYTVFADLDDLVLHVNAHTLEDLGDRLTDAVGSRTGGDTLAALATGYARFARTNRRLWDALFDHQIPDGGPAPDWLVARQTALLRLAVAPISEINPALTETELELRARTYFAAVHGIVAISLQRRFLGLPDEELEPELLRFVDTLVKGSRRPG